MAITYAPGIKTNRMTVVRDAIDAGASPGYIEIGTTGMASILAVIPFDAVSGVVSGDVLTFSNFPKSDPSAPNSGTAAEAAIRDGNAADVITGLTVGLAGTDIILDSLNISQGQEVKLNTAAITHAT